VILDNRASDVRIEASLFDLALFRSPERRRAALAGSREGACATAIIQLYHGNRLCLDTRIRRRRSHRFVRARGLDYHACEVIASRSSQPQARRT
jgi:hypothetical protein